MSLEFWGIQGSFYLGLPERGIGYVLLLGMILAIIRFGITNLRIQKANRRGLAALIIAAPIAAELFLIQLSGSDAMVSPLQPLQPMGPAFSLLAALPWVLAAGLLGSTEAVLVGFVAGLARGGWQTQQVLTPFRVALQAALFAWLIRRDYKEWLGRLARSPLFAATATATLMGAVGIVEVYANSAASTFDALNFAFSQASPMLMASMAEGLIAGLIAEGLRRIQWVQPAKLVTGPYNRTLAARLSAMFAVLGVTGGAILLYGNWLIARRSASELVEQQLHQTAGQVREIVPFFIQTGRSNIKRLGSEIAPLLAEPESLQSYLSESIPNLAFFSQVAVYDPNGNLYVSAPESAPRTFELDFELRRALELVREGIPQEVILASPDQSEGATLVYLSPVDPLSLNPPYLIMAGWTELASNPLLLPAVSRLADHEPGDAFMVDDRSRIIIDPGGAGLMQVFDTGISPGAGAEWLIGANGSRQLVLIENVLGYPWAVVATAPQGAIESLAFATSANLFAVIIGVGGMLLFLVYVSTSRLTRPLRQMASAAELISRGKLDHPVEVRSSDELGRLASSFEKMRVRLKSRIEDLNFLLLSSRQMASSFELESVLPPILRGIRELATADVVRVVLSARNTQPYSAGEASGDWKSLDEQLLALAAEQGQFVIDHPSRAKAVIDLGELVDPISALAAFTLTHEDQFLGALWLGHRGPHPYAEDDIHLLSILAGHLGVSLANAQLYQAAERERLRLAAVLDATPDAVIVTDRDGRISLANPAADIVLEGAAHEAIGELAEEKLLAPELVDLMLDPVLDNRASEIAIEGGRVMFASVSDVHAGAQDTSGRVCVLWDITQYKMLDNLKSEFVSTVSHDLRAPLTLMRGYGTMISMVGDVNDQQQEFVEKILKSVEQMTGLVDNLLDLGRIEAGVGLHVESVPMESILREVVTNYRPQAVNKQISLEFELGDDMQPVDADATLLRQAISNLVDNAIKYTQGKGSVSIRARQELGQQIIEVSDSGLGIAPADQARLFEKFFRARRPETLQEKGTGLGLAIVKSIVEQHGGSVQVESRLGEGSTFVMTLPIKHEEQAVKV
jgi:signal transduction histidine kinase/HAMP domain-containing protein